MILKKMNVKKFNYFIGCNLFNSFILNVLHGYSSTKGKILIFKHFGNNIGFLI
jgi:hypothetical protein